MINVVKQTGHSSYYVEKGIAASGKTARQVGILNVDEYAICGGGECLSLVHCTLYIAPD